MSRTRAQALVLVNWRGVFYERYLLDPRVTALEGANGSGKTTVMIAAYVVLLPDMARLRFTNLGETGATGGDKGIWGRLGEPGRPSYAVLDLALSGGGRLLAGVQLERRGEPSVEPTAFLITGLGPDVRLQELLLVTQGTTELVPELQELRERAAVHGGRLQTFTAVRDYLGALFDHGVSPLRLGTDEERSKFNDMLRTSMTGGISRALTSDLRAFLLKQEGGLADTLHRMRENLDACRRTRTEVEESQRLEQEIGGVFATGQRMFAAACLASRERAQELARRVEEAERAWSVAVAAVAHAEEALAQALRTLAATERQLAETGRERDEAQAWQRRLGEALTARRAAARAREVLDAAQQQDQTAAVAFRAADAEKERLHGQRRQAEERHAAAAAGLADLQRGLDELHYRAAAYRRVVRRQQEAMQHLARTALPLEELATCLADTRTALEQVDRERRAGRLRLDDAVDHRRAYAEALQALAVLEPQAVAGQDIPTTAREALRRYHAQRALAERLPELSLEREAARAAAQRQARVRQAAATLGVALGEGTVPGAVAVAAALTQSETELAAHTTHRHTAQTELDRLTATAEQLAARGEALGAQEGRWRELARAAAVLEEHLQQPLGDGAALDRARATLAQAWADDQRAEQEHAAHREQLLTQARALRAPGGAIPDALLALRDRLGAELVATAFEDVAVEEAAGLEACLGPLAQALVVDAPATVAPTLGLRDPSLPEVLLVPRGLDLLAAAGQAVPGPGADAIVADGSVVRVTRVPHQPRLGRRAREARARALEDEAGEQDRQRERRRAQRLRCERHRDLADQLLAERALWLAGDPAAAREQVERQRAETVRQIQERERVITAARAAARALEPRITALRALLPDAALLDPPDHGDRAGRLDGECQRAQEAQATTTRQGPAAAQLEERLPALRQAPLDDAGLVALQARLAWLQQERERLDAAQEALVDVDRERLAFAWGDAAPQLAERQQLVPALEAQLAQATLARDAAAAAAEAGERRAQAAHGRWQERQAEVRTAERACTVAQEAWLAIGIPDPTEEALAAAAERLTALERSLQQLKGMHEAALIERGRLGAEILAARARLDVAQAKHVAERAEAEPALARWQALLALGSEHGLAVEQPPGAEALEMVRGTVNLSQEAKLQRELLTERLQQARGGREVLDALPASAPDEDETAAEACLRVWLRVREWLRRRLPAAISEVDDPREALARLREQLANLEERLRRQEAELRGATADIAQNIEVQVRRARGQVLRLNAALDGVRFGSIEGIRVRVEPVERMAQVLQALREGAVQELLFQTSIPIEEALAEIFRRHGGSSAGSNRLLDYREYIHLQIQVRRVGAANWEDANPTRLSTGEAIGVGAALMMVVLTEWERDANLLRGRKTHGSLRFLFLDEANRLSQDNLGMLFDLCQALDLQLLIAAPEVARAEGNTTYRLVRRLTDDGREEVLVTGRRVRAGA